MWLRYSTLIRLKGYQDESQRISGVEWYLHEVKRYISTEEDTFFSVVMELCHEAHIWRHKGTLSKYGDVGIPACILSDNNGIKITLSRATEAIESLHQTKQHTIKWNWFTEEMKKEFFFNPGTQWELKHNLSKSWNRMKAQDFPKRKVHSTNYLHKKG